MDNAPTKNYLISVIMPVFNSEKYLDEAIQSVLVQTIGFDSIELILINDGSTDHSGEICSRYAEKYHNITYVQKQNGGVSSARNLGLKYASGRYVTFLDSDDLWEEKAFEIAIHYLEKYSSDIDVLCGKILYFEKSDSNHPLNYKYSNSGFNIIDLDLDPTNIHSTIGNIFFKKEILQGLSFNEELSISEDTLFVSQVFLRNCHYGVTKECIYYYRKRMAEDSLSNRKYYEKHMQNLEVCRQLFASSLETHQTILPFIQATALYILNWQFFIVPEPKFTDEQSEIWKSEAKNLLSQIDDEIICTPKWMSYIKKLCALRIKYGDLTPYFKISEESKITFNGYNIVNLSLAGFCEIFRIQVSENNLHLEGSTTFTYLDMPFRLFVKDMSGDFVQELIPLDFSLRGYTLINGEDFGKMKRFVVDMPLHSLHSLAFFVSFTNTSDEWHMLSPSFTLFSNLYRGQRSCYTVKGNYIFKPIKKNIKIYSYTKMRHFTFELKRLRAIITNKRLKLTIRIKYCFIRVIYHLIKFFYHKTIWIFTDKEWSAGDNAENLYRYSLANKRPIDKMYFSLQKISRDYKRVNGYGNVIEPFSHKYKLLFLLSDKFISSRAESIIINPFRKLAPLVNDLFHFDFIYLTHGTLFGDLSKMLNKKAMPINLFSVSTRMEKVALSQREYAYGESEVQVLGMARYDGYKNAPKEKIIAFLPTWRADIAGKVIPGTTTREYRADFKDSAYCKFYNDLINNDVLIHVMKAHGYTGEFHIHPAFEPQVDDFKGNDTIIIKESSDYEQILRQSSLMVTDYSGVAFDFGYQRKPIVYSHFDTIFNRKHTYGEETYFDYETQGFGPVAYNLNDTINYIVRYIKQDCVNEAKYQKRADDFFAYSDYKNCKRIFDAILTLP